MAGDDSGDSEEAKAMKCMSRSAEGHSSTIREMKSG